MSKATTTYTVEQTEEFEAWLDALPHDVQRIIAARMLRASVGLFGDCESVGDGVSEMRIHEGPGYRAYFTIAGRKVIFMLWGGTKKTQKKDIKKAKGMIG